MSDDRFEERTTAPKWRQFKDVAETAFDRAQRQKHDGDVVEFPGSWCVTK